MDAPEHEGWYWAKRRSGTAPEWEVVHVTHGKDRWFVSSVDEEVAGQIDWFEFGPEVVMPAQPTAQR